MKTMKISFRLYMLVALSLAIFSAALVYALYHGQNALVAERKAKLSAMDESMITLFKFYHGLETSGAITREEAQTRAKDAVRALRYEDSGYFWINDMKANIVMHPIKPALDGTDQSKMADPTGKFIFQEFVKAVQNSPTRQGYVDYLWPKPGFEEPVLKYSHVAGFEPWGWIVGTGVYADDLAALFRRNAIETAGILGVGGLAIVLVAFAIVRSVVGPIGRLQVVMTAISEEDVSQEVPETGRGDEIGQMAKVVAVLRDSVRERMELRGRDVEQQQRINETRDQNERQAQAIAKVQADAMHTVGSALERLANGDLTATIGEIPAEYAKLRTDFNRAVEALNDVISSIAQSTEIVHGSAGGIAEAANNLSHRTEQQAASLEETAAALDEITATVRSSSERAAEASRMVSETKQSTGKSGSIVRDAVSAMSRIEDASNRIGQIIGVIDEIAFQTNLLALNAGVEAARAGEAGRGFAVVAQEVRELAQRSANAAKEIKSLISNSAHEVETGVALVRSTGDALTEIEALVNKVNDQVNSIATAAKEQAVGLAEVNTAVNTMDQMTQQNAAMVEETSAASQTLTLESNQLKALLQNFRLAGRHETTHRRAA
ncbi:methyl-accepting chemotaxis protein [Rhizobium sp. RU36D]|uniref:methyl-accepting chemotaxis protein n=1 Tax=Rhizobium sp. RU36D TaxID=1907415 RepID=UPI0009D884D5|nr:methyl-accepting chemotaxis protein [Rhizobium sp. RU36D]SMC98708.1 methyl-accepting chemotaxis sensory transducer with Cache sensor [Rhizobium sp. RU36D]